MSVHEQVASAREAAHRLAVAPIETRDRILMAMADLIDERSAAILAANAEDAAREVPLWFSEEEIHSYRRSDDDEHIF